MNCYAKDLRVDVYYSPRQGMPIAITRPCCDFGGQNFAEAVKASQHQNSTGTPRLVYKRHVLPLCHSTVYFSHPFLLQPPPKSRHFIDCLLPVHIISIQLSLPSSLVDPILLISLFMRVETNKN